ncbi:MAG: cell division protein FtsZ [Candidatus Ratteibacteria bacterium]|jgi:cell division protein FtsZ
MVKVTPVFGESEISAIKIKVVGVGGGGGKIISRLLKKTTFAGVDFIGIDTDVQALKACGEACGMGMRKVQIGAKITQGIGGAGCDPEKGKFAANEDKGKIAEVFKDTHIVFLVAGLGGGTGTGAAPVVGKSARDLGALVIGIVTTPFPWEKREDQAATGLKNLAAAVDTLICIPNERLQEIVARDTPFMKAFEQVDDVVGNSIAAISDLINKPAHIMDLDFADIKRVVENGGKGIVGIGTEQGEKKTVRAIKAALSDPLLGEHGISQTQRVLVSIIGSQDLTLQDVNEAMETVQRVSDKVVFGLSIDEKREDEVKVTLIATGIESTGEEKKETTSIREREKEELLFDSDEENYDLPPALRRKSSVSEPHKTGDL